MRDVLLIDDDSQLAAMLRTYLAPHGIQLAHEDRATSGLHRARREPFDALLLDVMLPDGDGLELCRTLRASSTTPILMLTARGDDIDRILGLELGADDYIAKPFNPRELLARLRAVLRRTHPAAPSELTRFGRLEIDRAARSVRLDGVEASLTAHQFDLLVALSERPGRVLSRAQLMQAVRGEDLEAFDRSIDVHISRIRTAIEDDPRAPRRILTLRGAGYVFAAKQD
jgi:two-component system phosphate regulon response regulator OmpR